MRNIALLLGCGLVAGFAGGCGNANIECIPGGPVPLSAPVFGVVPGQGTVLQPGVVAGYAITANLDNGATNFRIVWTGDAGASGTFREFCGSVYTAGHFVNEIPGCQDGSCALESGDFVSNVRATSNGQRIDFDTIATTGLDGFDFSVDTEPVFFDLLINGVHFPHLVFYCQKDTGLGCNMVPPDNVNLISGFPFGLTAQ